MLDENGNEIIETPEVEVPETSLRDDIESSLAELTEAPETPEPVVPTAEAPEAPAREDGRDDKGRFRSKLAGPAGAAEPVGGEQPAGVPAAPVPAGTPVAAEPTQAAEPVERAPQSWKPLAREAWTKIPAEARQEVLRREAEVTRVLQESASARKTHGEFVETIRPYEAMIRAEAGDPIRAVQGLLQTAYQLRNSPPAQKAQIVANLISGYGVPIDVLDSVLAGQSVPAQHQAAPDPRVDQLMQMYQRSEQARQEQQFSTAKAQIDEAVSKHEFFADVRDDVADILELAGKRGQPMTIAQAYERAVAMSPDHQKILQQREAAKRAPAAQAQVQRAKAAAASVPSRPAIAPPRSAQNTSLREDLEETLRELQGR